MITLLQPVLDPATNDPLTIDSIDETSLLVHGSGLQHRILLAPPGSEGPVVTLAEGAR